MSKPNKREKERKGEQKIELRERKFLKEALEGKELNR